MVNKPKFRTINPKRPELVLPIKDQPIMSWWDLELAILRKPKETELCGWYSVVKEFLRCKAQRDKEIVESKRQHGLFYDACVKQFNAEIQELKAKHEQELQRKLGGQNDK